MKQEANKTTNIDYMVESFKGAVKHQNAQAQYNLGMIYYNGEIVLRDYDQGIYWIFMAAKQNHADAQFTVSRMFEKGQGTRVDHNQADFWLGKAVDNHSADAQFLRGKYLYKKNISSRENVDRGLLYLKKSADQGNVDAKEYIANCEYTG